MVAFKVATACEAIIGVYGLSWMVMDGHGWSWVVMGDHGTSKSSFKFQMVKRSRYLDSKFKIVSPVSGSAHRGSYHSPSAAGLLSEGEILISGCIWYLGRCFGIWDGVFGIWEDVF